MTSHMISITGRGGDLVSSLSQNFWLRPRNLIFDFRSEEFVISYLQEFVGYGRLDVTLLSANIKQYLGRTHPLRPVS